MKASGSSEMPENLKSGSKGVSVDATLENEIPTTHALGDLSPASTKNDKCAAIARTERYWTNRLDIQGFWHYELLQEC